MDQHEGRQDGPPTGVRLRRTARSVVARHLPTGVTAHGETEADAIRWLAEAVALHEGHVGAVDDPVAFLASRDE